MNTRNGQNRQGTSAETPLVSGHPRTFYGASGPVPRAPDLRPPPPYSTGSNSACREYEAARVHHPQQHSSPVSSISITKWLIAGTIILFSLASLFCYDLPTKISQYNEVVARLRQEQSEMRNQVKHLEKERIALWNETARLEKERIALDSSTLKMEGERRTLESAIRHSEEERSRLQRQTHMLEYERHSLEKEEVALREEREKWEKVREDRIPPGAFWEVVQPSPDCLSYGKREYWGILRNVPKDWTDLDACMSTPTEIKGVSVRRPDRCSYVGGSPYIRGFWTVDLDQLDCKPWHKDFHDVGCTNPGSGIRRIEAWIVGINEKGNQDWRRLCESTPMTWDHITYNTPTHCDSRRGGRKVAMWDIPDGRC